MSAVARIYVLRDERIRENCIQALRLVDTSKKLWSVVLRKYHANRSLEQNALYWIWVSVMAEFTGYTKADMHRVFKFQFLEVEELVNPFTGEILRSEPSTAGLSVEDMSVYLNSVQVLAGDMGVTLPTQEYTASEWGW